MKMKKFLAAMMAVTMIAGTGMTALAAGSGSAAASQSTGTSEGNSTSEAEAGGIAAEATGESVSEILSVFEPAGAAVSVAGTSAKTAISGAYAAKTVQGVVVKGSMNDIRSSLKLSDGQTPYIMVYDINAKKSPLAMESINAAAKALDAEVVATLNIELGAKSNGKFVRLSDGAVGMMIGLPKGVDTAKKVSVVCVRSGGKTVVLEDTDSNPKTVTFEVQGGLGAYAIVVK